MKHSNPLVTDFKSAGHKLTAPREVILSVLAQSSDHLGADEILKRARRADPRLNKSVVYRNLDLLTRLGVLSQTNLGRGHAEYELHRHPHHHHLVCRKCDRAIEMDAQFFARLDRELRAEYGFAADLDHLAIFGLCEKCRAEKNRGGHHPHEM